MNQSPYPSQVPGQDQQPQMPQQPPQQGQYEMPPAPQPGQPQQHGNDQNYGFQPVDMEPQKSSSKSWILIIVLLIVLIVGGIFFAAWEGWIKIGFLDSLLGKTTTSTTTTATPTTTTVTNDTTRKADLAKIKDALKAYFQANQKYPISATIDKTSDPNSVLLVLMPTYLANLPKDPNSVKYYGYTSDGKTFTLTAVLDDTTDPTGIKSGNYYIYKVTDSSTETPTASTGTSGSASSNATSQ